MKEFRYIKRVGEQCRYVKGVFTPDKRYQAPEKLVEHYHCICAAHHHGKNELWLLSKEHSHTIFDILQAKADRENRKFHQKNAVESSLLPAGKRRRPRRHEKRKLRIHDEEMSTTVRRPGQF